MRSSFAYDRDASVRGNLFQQNVAADPSGAAGGWCERFAAFDGGKSEREVGNENDGADGPGSQIVIQDVETGRAVGEDGALHLRVRRIDDSCSERP